MRRGLAAAVIGFSCSFAAVALAAPAGTAAPAPGAPGAPRPVAPAPGPAAPAAPAPVAGGEALPTVEQLRQQLAEGKHQEVLKHLVKLLGLRGERAKAYDRYELLMLRGEAALRGKATAMALDAFAQASRATEDPEQKAVARATELLIRRSKPLGYVPRAAPAARGRADAGAAGAAGAGPAARAPVGPPQPIPFIEEADRKRAFAALFDDEMAAVQPKVKAATNAPSLPPVIEAIKSLSDLRAIDIAANGSSERTKAISGELGAHAHRLISDSIGPMEQRVEAAWRSGSRRRVSKDRHGNIVDQLYGLWGLTSTEQNALKEVIATCEKIQPVAAELAAVTERAELIADAQAAQKLQARATEVLTYDYPNAGRYNKDPKQPAQR